MYLSDFLILFCVLCKVDGVLFDRFSGMKVNLAQQKELRTWNATAQCSIDVNPCTPHEGSRIDGTCNNYKHPTKGSAREPYLRLLKPDYANNRGVRMDKNGEPLPSARRVRTALQTTGRVEDKTKFNIAAYHMMEFINRDVSIMNGPLDYLRRRQYCCTPTGATDPRCMPIPVPNDDPYLKVTDIRCLNFSRAETFRDIGCTPETIPPEQINYQTPVLDLSTIYGVDDQALAKVRKYEHGQLILKRREHRYVPPNMTESGLQNLTAGALDVMKNKIIIDAMKNRVIGGLAGEILNQLPNTSLDALANAIPGIIAGLTPTTVSNVLPPIVNTIVGMIPGLITDTIPNLPNTIPGVVQNLPNTISESVPGLINAINSLIPGEVSMLIPNLVPNMTNEMVATITANMLSTVIANTMADTMVNVVIQTVTTTVLINTGDVCFQNNRTETTCYQFGFPEVGNYDLRTTTLTIFFMREHNRLAQILQEMNPCWRDDRLFKVARQLNIATASNIFMYELLPALLGYKNMLNYGLLSENVVHVAAYDTDAVPLVYAEYDNAVRYFNTLIDGRVKKFGEDYHYADEYPYSETLFRSGLLETNKNFEDINRGTFYQNSAKLDDILDPEVSETYYGRRLQRAHDLIAIAIQRGRDMGIRGYNDYRHLCGLKSAKRFEDLLDIMEIEVVADTRPLNSRFLTTRTYSHALVPMNSLGDFNVRVLDVTQTSKLVKQQDVNLPAHLKRDKVEALKKVYNNRVDDVDLLAGIISENYIQGVHVGPTLFCIMTKQLQLFRFSDRFWYERGDQLHSFSISQLHEIRKTNMARLACDNAEGIKHIQPEAFRNVRPGNAPVPCSHIPGPDLAKWFDESCVRRNYNDVNTHMPIDYKHKGMVHSHRDSVSDFSSYFDSLRYFVPNS